MDEKRQHNRNDKEVKTEVHTEEGMTFSTSRDMSNGGIFISTPEPMKIGTELELSLTIPGEDSINIKGIVRWIREDETEGKKAGMGIEFSDISSDDLNKLKDISKEHMEGQVLHLNI